MPYGNFQHFRQRFRFFVCTQCWKDRIEHSMTSRWPLTCTQTGCHIPQLVDGTQSCPACFLWSRAANANSPGWICYMLMQQQGWKAGNSASPNIITYPAKSQVLFVSDYQFRRAVLTVHRRSHSAPQNIQTLPW